MDRIARLTEFLQTSPQDSFLKHALALEYIKIKKEEEARKLFEEILDNEPGYVGSYYHFGKLLERSGDTKKAIEVYAKGMTVAKELKDNHSYNELQGVYDDLMDY